MSKQKPEVGDIWILSDTNPQYEEEFEIVGIYKAGEQNPYKPNIHPAIDYAIIITPETKFYNWDELRSFNGNTFKFKRSKQCIIPKIPETTQLRVNLIEL